MERRLMMPNLNEMMAELDNMLAMELSYFGFKKKRKHVFVRKQGDCLQHISILETKARGVPKVHIMVCVGFQYEQIEKVISFIQNKEYETKWATANINIDALMNSKVPYGFYVNESTQLESIVLDIFQAIKKYAFSFLNSCDTLEKYEKMLLERDKNVRKSTITLKRPEWNLLALAIILEHRKVEDIFEEYKEDFEKNSSLLQVAKERIVKYDILAEVGV